MEKSAFITGGSRGIGAATVKKFTEEGYKVVFVYRSDDEAAKKVMEETGALGIRCDVRDREALAKAVRDGKIYFGLRTFDALVCNAGISRNGLFMDMDPETEDEIIDTNYKGVANSIRAVMPLMMDVKNGAIVNVSSMWGLAGASAETVYAATKAAVIGLTRSLAVELGPSGIRVNAVAPGVIMTDMCKEIDCCSLDVLKDETPLERHGKPSDVAEAIFFLCSDKASFITGQVLGVDGGFIV